MLRFFKTRKALLIGGLLLISTLFSQSALSQTIRPSKSVFIRPSFGFVNYIGDNNISMTELGAKGQLELGYQITSELAIAGLYNFGEYTTALRPDPATGLDRSGNNTRLSSAQALLRFIFGRKTAAVAPYIQAGAGVAFGGDHNDDKPGWGPVGGIGFDVLLSPTTLFFVEANTHFTIPDDAIDGPDRGLFAGHDLLNGLSLGIQINFKKKAFIPAQITDVQTPIQLTVDEVGSFIAEGNMRRATEPMYYNWDFGDGTTSPLQNASHSYAEPGQYTVTFNFSNKGSADFVTRTVNVVPVAAPAEIVAMNTFPGSPDTATPVTFDANVVGSEPYDYRWNFGDGNSSNAPSPQHRYTSPGTYNVELVVSNNVGTDRKTMSVSVAEVEAAYCKEVEQLTTVYFGRHSSVLSQSARNQLQDNLNILLECPNISVRVEGYAVPGEQNPTGLSADRARAVEDFYVRNGVVFSRVYAEGKGQVQRAGKLKDGAELFRRADTIIADK